MSNKQQLKPLNHKKYTNSIEQIGKAPISKEIVKSESIKATNSSTIKPHPANKPSSGDGVKPIKYQRSAQRSLKTVEQYDCDDDFGCELEDNNYFEHQLQKNIKTEILNKTGKPQAKANIVLPKLEGDSKMKNMKQMERQMDNEMQKMMEKDLNYE